MVAYNKFYQFVEDLGVGVHNLADAGDVVEVYLSNAAPSASADAVKADLAEISIENGYDGGADISNDYSQSAGVATLTGSDKTWTATAGGFGPLQYAAMFNETATNDPLIAWWDYGSAVTPAAAETFTVDFGASIFTLE
jgi:hypothetical protein